MQADGSGSMEGYIKFWGEKLEAVRLGKRMGNKIMVEAEGRDRVAGDRDNVFQIG